MKKTVEIIAGVSCIIMVLGGLPFLAYLGAVASTPYENLPTGWGIPGIVYMAAVSSWSITCPIADRMNERVR